MSNEYGIILTSHEEGTMFQGWGSSLWAAAENLVANIEALGCDEYADSPGHKEMMDYFTGYPTRTYFEFCDMSCPEDNFTARLLRPISAGIGRDELLDRMAKTQDGGCLSYGDPIAEVIMNAVHKADDTDDVCRNLAYALQEIARAHAVAVDIEASTNEAGCPLNDDYAKVETQ